MAAVRRTGGARMWGDCTASTERVQHTSRRGGYGSTQRRTEQTPLGPGLHPRPEPFVGAKERTVGSCAETYEPCLPMCCSWSGSCVAARWATLIAMAYTDARDRAHADGNADEAKRCHQNWLALASQIAVWDAAEMDAQEIALAGRTGAP